MASVSRNAKGFCKVQFTGLDRKRRTLYCGKMAKKDADNVCRHVDSILAAELSQNPLATDTAAWLGKIPDVFYRKLAAVGLIMPRKSAASAASAASQQLGPFLDSYIAKRIDTKPATRIVFGRARSHLVEFFGATCELASVTEGQAEDFALHLTGKKKMAEATVRKMCGVSRQFFRSAMKHKLITSNPFDSPSIKTTVRGNADRFRFITTQEAEAVIAACPDAQWRLIFALSRWGGLRCPSEHLALRLDHVDWANDRIIVPQPKVEHHGTPERLVPIFPELRPHLLAVVEAAEPGTEWLITKYRCKTSNLRTQFLRILRRAGIPA